LAPETVYEQFFVDVTLDSQNQHDIVHVIKPLQTLANEKSRKVVVGKKSTRGISATMGANISPSPSKFQVTAAATGGYTGEASSSVEDVVNALQVNLYQRFNRVSWKFDFDDPALKEDGIKIVDDMLPTADYRDATSPRFSRIIGVEITSHWSVISPNKQRIPWLNGSSEPLQTAPRYSNICQSVALKIPSNLTEAAVYKAELVVDLQNLDSNQHIPPIVDLLPPLVSVTPRVSSDPASANPGI
jgi:hypothetical protein